MIPWWLLIPVFIAGGVAGLVLGAVGIPRHPEVDARNDDHYTKVDKSQRHD